MAEKKTRTRKTKNTEVTEAKLEKIEAEAEASPEVQANKEEPKKEENKPHQVQVNVDFLRKTKVHIAMPCYGGMLTEATFTSFIKWANTAKQLGIDWTLETMVNESLISRGRNTLVAKFLGASEDTTHLMFIDADIGWEPWHLLVLLNRDVDVIGGLYPMKSLPVKWVVNGIKDGEEGPDGLQEVSKAGTGFLLIKRHVFDKLNDHPAVKPYKNDIGLDVKFDQFLKTYFDTAVRENRYLSEDWTFCANWRDLGGKIFIDRRVLLRHSGSYVFSHENQEHLLKTIGPMYLNQQVKENKVKILDEAGNSITTT